RLAAFRRLCAPAVPQLAVTSQRARALGLESKNPMSGSVGLAIGDQERAAAILALAADVNPERNLMVVPVSTAAGAAIELAKLAQGWPGLLIADGKAADRAGELALVAVAAPAVAKFRQAAVASLAVAAEANVPLSGGLQARFVIFRDAIGGSAVAVI